MSEASPPSTGDILYITALSPFGARLRLVCAFTGQSFTETPPPGGSGSDEMKAITFFGRMPAIEVNDHVLIESLPLMEYLVERAGGSPLVPTTPEARALMRGIMAAHDNYVLGAIWPMFLQLRSGKPDMQVAVDALHAASGQYDTLARMLSATSSFAVGDTISLADLAMVPFCLLNGAMYAKFGVADPFAANARLKAWREAVLEESEVVSGISVTQAALAKAFG